MKNKAAIDPRDAYDRRGTLTRCGPARRSDGSRKGWLVDAVCDCHVCGPVGTKHTYRLSIWQNKFNDSTCFAGSRRRRKRAGAHVRAPRFDGITAERAR